MIDHLVLKRNRINKGQIFMKFLRNLGKNRLRVVKTVKTVVRHVLQKACKKGLVKKQ